MGTVAVVTDTCHYLPRQLVAARGIHEVSLYVHWDGREDRESELPDFDAYYEHLRTAKQLPTTSQPSIGDFLAVYEPLLEDGREIVSIHLSGAISGTFASAAAGARAAARTRRRAHPRHRLAERVRRPGDRRARRARRGRARRDAEAGRRARARGARARCRCGSPSTRSSTCGGAGASAPRRHGSARR